ncbi:ABC transporter substrate-binding protein [Thermodesulfobacteriota bacterium]
MRIAIIILYITIGMLIGFTGSAEAGPNILAVQSIRVAPYEDAIRGFEQASDTMVKRVVISELQHNEVEKIIQKNAPDLVLAVGMDALIETRRIKNTPIVYLMVLNPESILAKEPNITGVSMNLSPERQLDVLLNVLPEVPSLGLLYNPKRSGRLVRDIRKTAENAGVKLIAIEIERSRDVPLSLSRLKGKIDVFWMIPDTTVITPETLEYLLLFSMNHKIPILTFSDKYLNLGAMLAIGIDAFDIGRQAGEIGKIILSGRRAKTIRPRDARKAIISINLKIAKKLGVRVNENAIKNARIIP